MKKFKLSILIGLALALSFGFFASGTNLALATPPDVTCNGATIYGTIEPNGNPVQAWFEWGTDRLTVQRGSGTKVGNYSIAGNVTQQTVSYNLTGLQQNTTYYYRLVIKIGNDAWPATTEEFTTTSCQSQPPEVNIGANPTTVNQNESSTISWNTNNAVSCVGNVGTGTSGWPGPKNKNGGSFDATFLNQTTTFRITCENAIGQTATDSVVVTVNPATTATGSLTISPSSCNIQSGQSTCKTNATWNTNHSANTRLIDKNTGTLLSTAPNSTSPLAIWVAYQRTTLDLKNGTQLLDSKSVTASCVSGTTWNGTICTSNAPTNTTGNISATSCTIPTGQSICTSFLNWNILNNVPGAQTMVTKEGPYTIISNLLSASNFSNENTKISEGSTTFSLRHNNIVLDTATANASCASNATWNGTICSASYSTGTTGNISATSCTIPVGGSSCTSALTWNVINPVNGKPTTVTREGTNVVISTANFGTSFTNQSTLIDPNGATFNLRHNNIVLDTATVNASCAYGSTWNGTQNRCLANSSIDYDIYVNTNSATNIDENSATLRGDVTANGAQNIRAWFEWGKNTSMTNSTSSVYYGSNPGTINYNLHGLSPDTRYYFRAVAQNNYGEIIYGQRRDFTTDEDNNDCDNYYNYCDEISVITYPADTSRNSATLRGYLDLEDSDDDADVWFEWGTNNSYQLYNSTPRRNKSSSGNFNATISNLNLNTIYYYRAVAKNSSQGTVYGNVRSFTLSSYNIDPGNCGMYGTCAPQAITTLATNIGQASARLNGLSVTNGNVSTTGYFEYGTNASFGNTTTIKNIGAAGGSIPFFDSIFGLSPNTLYYYRAVVSNQYGMSYGEITTFRTGTTVVYNNTNTGSTNIAYNNTRVVSSNSQTTGDARQSLVLLDISRNGDYISIGNIVEYEIHYKNVSSESLKGVVIRTSLPGEFEFMETSSGFYAKENHMVISPTGDLFPQQEGSVRIRTRVKEDAPMGKLVVVTANLAYTIINTGIQEETFAYSQSTIEGNGVGLGLGAASIFGFGFLPSTLLGWLFLILIILLLLAVIRWFYDKPQKETVHHQDPPPPDHSPQPNH